MAAQDIIISLIACLAVGAIAGAVGWEVIAAAPARRRLELAEERRKAETFRANQASQQAAAFSLLLRVATGRNTVDSHLGSRRAPDIDEPTLRVV